MAAPPDTRQQPALMPPRWVEVGGHLAVIVCERRDALLVRYASARRSHYQWVGWADCERRADCDGVKADPSWLVQAKRTARPGSLLFALVHGLSTAEPDAVPERPAPEFETDTEGRPL